MNIRDELNNLSTPDIYSLMLFVLYKSTTIPEYASLSQLAYILDKDSLLKLCEFYGGITIKIPTVTELQNLLEGLLMYQLINIENQPKEEVEKQFNKDIKSVYEHIVNTLKDYNFRSGRKLNDVQE